MTRFIIGLLLGLLIGIGGTAAFLITANGSDYLIASSPRVRELEASLKNVEQDRQWLRARLNEANESLAKLESRFSDLAARFDRISSGMEHGSAGTTAEPSPGATPDAEAAPAGSKDEPGAANDGGSRDVPHAAVESAGRAAS